MISKELYRDIIQLLTDLRIVHGPEFVNGTLLRHQVLRRALLDYEKRAIIDLESSITSEG